MIIAAAGVSKPLELLGTAGRIVEVERAVSLHSGQIVSCTGATNVRVEDGFCVENTFSGLRYGAESLQFAEVPLVEAFGDPFF